MSKQYTIDRITEAHNAKETLLESLCNDYPQFSKTNIRDVFNNVWIDISYPSQEGKRILSAIDDARTVTNAGASPELIVDQFVSTYGLKTFMTYTRTKKLFKNFYKH